MEPWSVCSNCNGQYTDQQTTVIKDVLYTFVCETCGQSLGSECRLPPSPVFDIEQHNQYFEYKGLRVENPEEQCSASGSCSTSTKIMASADLTLEPDGLESHKEVPFTFGDWTYCAGCKGLYTDTRTNIIPNIMDVFKCEVCGFELGHEIRRAPSPVRVVPPSRYFEDSVKESVVPDKEIVSDGVLVKIPNGPTWKFWKDLENDLSSAEDLENDTSYDEDTAKDPAADKVTEGLTRDLCAFPEHSPEECSAPASKKQKVDKVMNKKFKISSPSDDSSSEEEQAMVKPTAKNGKVENSEKTSKDVDVKKASGSDGDSFADEEVAPAMNLTAAPAKNSTAVATKVKSSHDSSEDDCSCHDVPDNE